MRLTEEQYQQFLRDHPKCSPDRIVAHIDAMAQRKLKTSSPGMTQPKRPKYGNRKVTDASGAVHDSTKEFKHWQDLQLRERAGEITSLRRQVPFALAVNGVLVCQFVADFVYREGEAEIVEDCKSPQTRKLAAFRIKSKLMAAIHGLQVREV